MDPTNALNAHAAPSPGPDPFPPADSAGTPNLPGVHPVPDPPHLAPDPPTQPLAAPTPATHSLAHSGEQCPSCGSHVAPDQRYCLRCGERCGDPRLPFMSAVTFMDAMKSPATAGASAPPPRRQQRRMSPNMALFATIGVLLLAMGVGVLIGRSGNHSVANAPQSAPIVIHEGGSEELKTASSGTESGKTGGSTPKVSKKSLQKKADTNEGAKQYLPESNVPLAEPKVKLGDKCKEGTAGCEGEKFTGNFFGSE